MTERLRLCVPVPHDLVHVDHALKADVAQWTGQGPWLHGCVSAVCGQALPPCRGAVLTRLRDWKPAAHDVEHVDQALNETSTQSTGQLWALQARVSAECGQALPPSVGSTVARLRFCEPVPQDLVHVDQAPNAGTLQSTAHAATLQLRVSARYGHT